MSIRRAAGTAALILFLGLAGCQDKPEITVTATPPKAQSRLLKEKSPYLHQHADNEVDWYAWGEEAFEKAKKEDKPIFLSIGYSTCHWCHVMEKESFMDAEVGAYLNQYFVSIKVDRETRPDVDAIYMNYVQQSTGSGGWPLTVFLTPRGVPIYGGTYFPNPPRFGKMGFLELLQKVAQAWTADREKIVDQAGLMAKQMASQSTTEASEQLAGEEAFVRALAIWKRKFDPERGGFLPAPKFPSQPDLDFLLRYAATKQDEQAQLMVLRTLDNIALGGIRDHLDGGFHRYSTDAEWLVPHFEKMLYDQAQMVELYSRAYALESKPLYRDAVETTLDYLERRMRSPEGGFYSAEDADSTVPGTQDEHAEGAFYVWTESELREALDPEEYDLAKKEFGVTKEGNAAGDPQGELDQKNVLHLSKFEDNEAFHNLLEKLREARDARPRPLRDDKILTEWNAMLAAGYAEAGRYLQNEAYLRTSGEILSFIENKMVQDHVLLRSYLAGAAEGEAFAGDHAQLVRAYLSLFQATGDPQALDRAVHWQKVLDSEFWDEEHLGYFDTKAKNELLYRKKSAFDGATMSPNSVTAINLQTLHSLTGDEVYADRQQQLLKHLTSMIQNAPDGVPGALSSLLGWYGRHRSLILMSSDQKWTKPLLSEYRPDLVIIAIESKKDRTALIKHIPYLPPWATQSRGYFCQDFSCELPVQDLETIRQRL